MAKSLKSFKTIFIYVVFCSFLLLLSISLSICLMKEFSADNNKDNDDLYSFEISKEKTGSYNDCSLFDQYMNIIVKLCFAFIGGVLVSDGSFIKIGAL